MNGFRLKAYCTFRIKAFHWQGIHSPFVFALDRLCLHDKKKYDCYKKLRVFKKYLSENKVKTPHKSFEISKLLYRLVNHLQAKNALVLGESSGMEIVAMANGNTKNIHVVSEVPLPKTALQYFAQNGMKKITQEVISPNLFLERDTRNIAYDLVLFHKNNSTANTSSLFENALPLTHNDTVFIFEKIHDSKENEQVWKSIQQHQKVHVTVDVFNVGLVFFRKEQAKEHFVVGKV